MKINNGITAPNKLVKIQMRDALGQRSVGAPWKDSVQVLIGLGKASPAFLKGWNVDNGNKDDSATDVSWRECLEQPMDDFNANDLTAMERCMDQQSGTGTGSGEKVDRE